MTDRIEFTPDYGPKENSNIIKVIGVGGGGSNAVKHMYSEGIVGVDFLVCNTDQGHLSNSPIPDQLLLGTGLGAGKRPEVAQQYANESKEKIKDFIGKETKMLFITAGMGKGTGTGASPVIAEVAREMGILTIGVVTTPFNFEGKVSRTLATDGINEMSKYVDSLIVIKNEKLLEKYQDLTMQNAYGQANDVLKNAVKCIAELITVDYDQNVDFNDIATIMKDSGKAMLGLAMANGEDRVQRVIDDALSCPLLDNANITEAQNFLFFISYGPDCPLKISELSVLTNKFDELQDENAHVIWGQGEDPKLGDNLKLSVIVTKFNGNEEVENVQDAKEATVNTTTAPATDHNAIELDDSPLKTKTSIIENPSAINEEEPTMATSLEMGIPVVPNTTEPVFVAEKNYSQPEVVNVAPAQPQGQTYQQPTQIYAPTPVHTAPNRLDDEKEFEIIINTPSIYAVQNRSEQYAQAQAQAQAQTQTLVMNEVPTNNSSFFEIENDAASFFSCLAD